MVSTLFVNRKSESYFRTLGESSLGEKTRLNFRK